MKIAVAQLAATHDVTANRERCAGLVRAAGERRADLVVLPEAAMHPFGRPELPLRDVAETLDGPFVSALVDAAKHTGATVIAGMFSTVEGNEHVDNTVVAVTGDGLVGSYRKVHLFDALGWRESDRLRAGDPGALLTLPVGEFTVGVLTCYDLRFPEIGRALVDAGATMLAVPAAWVAGPLKEDHWSTLVRARAIENTCYVAAAGQAPPEFVGRSMVVDPMGVVLAGLGEQDDAVAVAEIGTDRLAQVRQVLPSLEHRRFTVAPRR